MSLILRRPILVGGLGLTLSFGVMELLHPASTHWASTIAWGAVALGSGIWWLKQQTLKPLDLSLPTQPVDRAAVEKSLADVETLLAKLDREAAASAAPATRLTQLREQLAQRTAELDRQEMRLAIVGGRSVGKTALRQQLATSGLPKGLPGLPTQFSISDVPGLFGEHADQLEAAIAPVVRDADLVLFVTAGDLTCSEFDLLQQWVNQQQRVLLVFNKQDQYLPTERPLILQQLRDRVKAYLAAEDVVAIAAAPAPIKVRQHQADGLVQERTEQPAPDLAPLTGRLAQALTQMGQPLVQATVMRQAIALKAEVITELNRVRRERALPLIEQAQWIAAAAAFANPVPTLDLLATAAVNTQLVMDLAGVYQQQFSLEQAKTIATTLAAQMVKLGLVELSSQAIAPLLKSHALTYVAGGMLQGVSAAYLTRIAGLTLATYFEEQSFTAPVTVGASLPDRLAQKLKAVFQDNQRAAFLQGLVKQAIDRLMPSAAPALPSQA